MGNMFCTELRIHRRFDLKGSSQGRVTEKGTIDETTTLKDLDLDFVFRLEPAWREAFLRSAPWLVVPVRFVRNAFVYCAVEGFVALAGWLDSPSGARYGRCRQIENDCEFLESQRIMDYSLLLGLHFRAPQYPGVATGPSTPDPSYENTIEDGEMPP